MKMGHVLAVALVGGILASAAAIGAGSAEPTAHPVSAAQARFSGIWAAVSPVSSVLTTAGKLPPMTAAARTVYRQHVAARKAGDTSFDRASWCASPGMPRFMFMPYEFDLAVSGRRVAFMHGWSNWFRIVDMTGADIEPLYPTAMGYGMGHWEGDTLVIVTRGLTHETTLDGAGLPHSDDMVLTERLRLVDENLLEDRIQISDPATFTKAWETVMTYKRLTKPSAEEFTCLDSIKRGGPAIEGE